MTLLFSLHLFEFRSSPHFTLVTDFSTVLPVACYIPQESKIFGLTKDSFDFHSLCLQKHEMELYIKAVSYGIYRCFERVFFSAYRVFKAEVHAAIDHSGTRFIMLCPLLIADKSHCLVQ